MGDILIRLRGNTLTGRREIVIDYESDDDLTQAEHEQRHRQIVEQLIREGHITRDDVEDLVFDDRRETRSEGQQSAEGQGS